MLFDIQYPIIITISGTAGSGKSTMADIIKETTNKKCLVLNNADYLKFICQKYFGWDGKKDEKGRTILQHVGTDVIRAKDPNFWTNKVAELITLFYNDYDVFIVPDTRFINEVTNLKKHFGNHVFSIKLIRDHYDNGLTEAQKQHASEQEIPNTIVDFIMQNDGDLNYFKQSIEDLCLDLGLIDGGINKKMKRVFISHPYTDDPIKNKEEVDSICKEIMSKNLNILPISPLHLFSFVDGEVAREDILVICYELISICDELWVYGDSPGCKQEVECAQSLGVPILNRIYSR